ncbi:uncharacterized protein LOC112555237 [Pomacea canaliculata]|uniref:uncharacterized protein LOC112555237 n=1 Tax=Pomacea canaliculata TaxID=400727 RepID=UPI000D727CD6|nr:uncharacterized protein LOC112555237 [Pomacea canaliculata]
MLPLKRSIGTGNKVKRMWEINGPRGQYFSSWTLMPSIKNNLQFQLKKMEQYEIWYKAIVDFTKKMGPGRSRWNSRMAEILEGDPSFIPPVTSSSLGGCKSKHSVRDLQ